MGKLMDGPWKVYFEQGRSYEHTIEFIKRISNDIGKCIWYFHPTGKAGKGPHFHGLVYNYKKTDETFRNTIKKELNIEGSQLGVSNKLPKKLGNGVMTELLTPTYITYMSKGQFEPVYYKEYTSEYVQELKNLWVDQSQKHNVTADNIIFVEDKKKDKITQWELARIAHSRYLDNEPISDGVKVNKLIKYVIQVLKENKKLAHKRAVTNVVQDIYADLSPEEYINQIKSMI